MTITTASAARTTTATGTRTIWRHAAVAAVAAAAATAAVAAVAHSAGVPLTLDGEPIPPSGFATMTLLGAVIGFGIAVAMRRWARNPQRAFVRTSLALTALSFVPDLLVPAASADTRITLMATHVVAAAIVIPVIAARLAQGRR
jgi:hypothetical protein